MTLLLKPVFPVLEYFVNYDYIVTELCENKEKPELECNGKCHLAKELASASNPESTDASDKKVVAQQYELVYFQEIQSVVFNFLETNLNLGVTNCYSDNYFHLGSSSTFHPPTI